VIQFRSLTLARGARRLIEDATLQIHPGWRVGLVGANGSGKSSLFALLRGELHADSGDCEIPGGWTIASSGDSCQLFMTLTSWTGGYRASTRGCSTDVLKSISAWNLNGKQVVLAGTGGSPVATLFPSGNTRFDGQTGQGAAVSFYR